MRVLIVDDEPLAQTALKNILSARSDVDEFDTANDAIDALEKISTHSYDVLLLDINMPELSGIQLLDRLRDSQRQLPAVVFVTAHDKYAVAAFEKHAVDYVLKPFSKERINAAVDVAFRRQASDRAARLAELLPQLESLSKPRALRLAVKSKGRIVFIDPADILAVQAEGNYVLFLREGGSHFLRESISTIAKEMEPYGFIRIHRSVLVNASYVEEIHPWPTGEYGIRLKGGKEFTVTRTYKKNLKSLAKLWVGTDRFLDSIQQ